MNAVERTIQLRVSQQVPLAPPGGGIGIAIASSLSCGRDVLDVMLPNCKVDCEAIKISEDELQNILSLTLDRPPKPLPHRFAEVTELMAMALTATLQDPSAAAAWCKPQNRLGVCLALHTTNPMSIISHLIGSPSRSDERRLEHLHHTWSETPLSPLLLAETCLSL
jgi:hypothetical protein